MFRQAARARLGSRRLGSLRAFGLLRFIVALTMLAMALVAPPRASAKEMMKDIEDLNYLLENGILQAMLAKEICTCRYLNRLTLAQCQEHSQMPESLFMVVSIEEDNAKKTITVRPNLPISSMPALAGFKDKTRGCGLYYGILELGRDGRGAGSNSVSSPQNEKRRAGAVN